MNSWCFTYLKTWSPSCRLLHCVLMYVEGVPLRICGRNLPLQQLTGGVVTSISAAIHVVHLSTWVIWPGKNSMELFFKAKFDFKSTWNCDRATSHHKHPVRQSPARDTEKLTKVWLRYFGTNRIIDNCHRCRGVMWRKWNNYFDKWFKEFGRTDNYYFIGPYKFFSYHEDLS